MFWGEVYPPQRAGLFRDLGKRGPVLQALSAKTGQVRLIREEEKMAKTLIVIGFILLVVGICWPWLAKLPLGRLPGDIIIRRENFRLYLPITTCIVVSLLLSLLLRLFRK